MFIVQGFMFKDSTDNGDIVLYQVLDTQDGVVEVVNSELLNTEDLIFGEGLDFRSWLYGCSFSDNYIELCESRGYKIIGLNKNLLSSSSFNCNKTKVWDITKVLSNVVIDNSFSLIYNNDKHFSIKKVGEKGCTNVYIKAQVDNSVIRNHVFMCSVSVFVDDVSIDAIYHKQSYFKDGVRLCVIELNKVISGSDKIYSLYVCIVDNSNNTIHRILKLDLDLQNDRVNYFTEIGNCYLKIPLNTTQNLKKRLSGLL